MYISDYKIKTYVDLTAARDQCSLVWIVTGEPLFPAVWENMSEFVFFQTRIQGNIFFSILNITFLYWLIVILSHLFQLVSINLWLKINIKAILFYWTPCNSNKTILSFRGWNLENYWESASIWHSFIILFLLFFIAFKTAYIKPE